MAQTGTVNVKINGDASNFFEACQRAEQGVALTCEIQRLTRVCASLRLTRSRTPRRRVLRRWRLARAYQARAVHLEQTRDDLASLGNR